MGHFILRMESITALEVVVDDLASPVAGLLASAPRGYPPDRLKAAVPDAVEVVVEIRVCAAVGGKYLYLVAGLDGCARFNPEVTVLLVRPHILDTVDALDDRGPEVGCEGLEACIADGYSGARRAQDGAEDGEGFPEHFEAFYGAILGVHEDV